MKTQTITTSIDMIKAGTVLNLKYTVHPKLERFNGKKALVKFDQVDKYTKDFVVTFKTGLFNTKVVTLLVPRKMFHNIPVVTETKTTNVNI